MSQSLKRIAAVITMFFIGLTVIVAPSASAGICNYTAGCPSDPPGFANQWILNASPSPVTVGLAIYPYPSNDWQLLLIAGKVYGHSPGPGDGGARSVNVGAGWCIAVDSFARQVPDASAPFSDQYRLTSNLYRGPVHPLLNNVNRHYRVYAFTC